ncbi:iron ABC transporter substrate-binding protein [Natroniella acetigena]|uniref:iron ABC transporter substrate-binding protein n=1 Tax=Natroniella acetigena TaxID=52004 RepID=UPI00200AF8EA|nr:iron ABC transporter substrate-binding protein [Natroniella acetigena]MCK8827174.1 iron ABC transporter substrate-binding protein [Natroniella acetigena]
MRKRKRYGVAVVMLALLIVIGGCGNQQVEEEMETVKIEDMAGREVEVPKDVDEIVGLGAGCMRLITYMDAVEYLVGVEEYEHEDPRGRPYAWANPEFSELPSVGSQHTGEMELIAAQDPDVIFRASSAAEADDYQERTGIPTIDLRVGDLNENRDAFYKTLRLIGQVLDKEDRAEEVIDYTESTIRDLQNRTEDIPSEEKPEVYVGGVLHRGGHDLRSTYGNYAPFQFVNAKDVADNLDLGTEHVMVDDEMIIEWDPDIIFIDMGSYTRGALTLEKPQYEMLSAVQDENLYGVLPYNWYTINYGTVLANSYYIGTVLYPEEFSDITPEEKADEIYEKLVGEPVFEKMQRDLGGFEEFPRD